ncbi:MAG: hypothetical protein ABFS37_10110 [Acidobacteriota bacterium]
MSRLTDSSELQEALSLFQDLFEEQRHAKGFAGPIGRNLEKGPVMGPDVAAAPAEVLTQAPLPTVPVIDETEGEFRGDRLENVLFAMCRRGGFTGAVVSDGAGLPLAVYNSPVDNDRIAAFTSVLGDAMAKAGLFLEQHGAEYISMDINYEDKVVVRRFVYAEMEMYLLVLCAQSMDERAEVEMSIEQIVSILG